MRNSVLASLLLSALIAGFIFVNYDEDKMLETMYLSGFIGDSADITEAEFQQAFADFLATYRKSYENSYQFENRYLIFRDNYQRISDHNLNAEHIGFELAVNEFADMTQDEFSEKYLGFNPPTHGKHHGKPRHHRGRKHRGEKRHEEFNLSSLESLFEAKEEEPFEYMNWADTDKVHAPKNQGSCGSCWAFSAIGAIESAYAIQHDEPVLDLSEQQFVDCVHVGETSGCQGGFMDDAFTYSQDHAVCSSTEYPYKAKNQACQIEESDFACEDKVHVTDFVDVQPNSKAAMKEALDKGPVSIGVSAGNLGFQFYFKGVLRFLCGKRLDHGVLAVGYGHQEATTFLKATDYWIVKNSWGKSWGEHGYLRIKANENKNGGTCGVLQVPSYPVVE